MYSKSYGARKFTTRVARTAGDFKTKYFRGCKHLTGRVCDEVLNAFSRTIPRTELELRIDAGLRLLCVISDAYRAICRGPQSKHLFQQDHL